MWWNRGLMRNKDRNTEWNLDNGCWIHCEGMQHRRQVFVNNLDKERELLDNLELQSMDELQLEPADPGWLEHFSCLGHRPAEEISPEQNQNTRLFRKINAVAKEDDLRLKERPVDPTIYNWTAFLENPIGWRPSPMPQSDVC